MEKVVFAEKFHDAGFIKDSLDIFVSAGNDEMATVFVGKTDEVGHGKGAAGV